MNFKYFNNPEKYTGLIKEKTFCNCCGKEKFCYDTGSFYGENKIEAICTDCLGEGLLRKYNITTCTGDITELKKQLKEKYPKKNNDEIEKIALEKTEELEFTTPQLITWQEWFWPCIDGEYCKFIGYGSIELYNKLSNEKGKKLFEESLYYVLREFSDIEFLWSNCMPEKHIKDYNESSEFGTLFYLFKSINSEKYVTIWDSY